MGVARMPGARHWIVAGTIVVGTVFIGLNLFSDLLYRLVDPRAR